MSDGGSRELKKVLRVKVEVAHGSDENGHNL